MWKNIFKILSVFIIGIVGGIFANQILWPYFVERPLLYKYRLDQLERPIQVIEQQKITIQENIALQNAIQKDRAVVVGIKTDTKSGQVLTGSGLIVSSDGLIVTLAKLVPGGCTFHLFADPSVLKEKVRGRVLKQDLENNLALIKIEVNGLPTVSFADLEKIGIGERVFLAGRVFNGDKVDLLVNEGIIKVFSPDLIITNISEGQELQGSPLFNIKGETVGICDVDQKGHIITISASKLRKFAGL